MPGTAGVAAVCLLALAAGLAGAPTAAPERVAALEPVGGILPEPFGVEGPGVVLRFAFAASHAGPPAPAVLELRVHECVHRVLVLRWARDVPLPAPGGHHEPVHLLRAGPGTEGFLLTATLRASDGWAQGQQRVLTWVHASSCWPSQGPGPHAVLLEQVAP
jgi:hypothetical protein